MRRAAIIAVILLVATACGTSESSETTTTAPNTTTTAAPAATGVDLSVSDSSLGDIVVDADGRTLYLFLPDAQGESTCYDQCATNWPPLVGDVVAGDGIDSGLLGTTTRTDGSSQATYGGWPLYYFAGDASAGDVNGQGLNGVWFVVDPTGSAIGQGAPEGDAGASSDY